MDTEEIISKALSRPLSRGNHLDQSGACIMEAIAWAAGEPWSDFPACVPRDVARLCQSIHDAADPSDYSSIWTPERLRGVLGASHDIDAIRGRSYTAAEYAKRVVVDSLRKRGRDVSVIEACARVTDRASAIALRDALRSDAAYAATYATVATYAADAAYAATADAADAAADAAAAAYAATYATVAATYATVAATYAADAAYAATYATVATYAADAATYATVAATYAADVAAADASRQKGRIEILDAWIGLDAARTKGGV